jgi:CheY-like chemotaxis protein
MQTILVVEDSETNVLTTSLYLESKGYHITVARNGQEALEMVRTKHPAVILMDLQMPVMDGLETMRKLRQDSDPQIANLPIIAVTALAMPGDRERAMSAGATEYMSKPVRMKQLFELIKRLAEV